MKHTYKINGMTCKSCTAKVKSALLSLPDVLKASVDKETDSAEIEMSAHISLDVLNKKLKEKGTQYSIEQIHSSHKSDENLGQQGITVYKPIFLVFGYILATTLLIEYKESSFDLMHWMPNFMAGFFLVFSFFKLLDLDGFANSYMSYDIIAKR